MLPHVVIHSEMSLDARMDRLDGARSKRSRTGTA
jgi:riboflavin biosynthesis pyrimidine reductase